MAPNITDTLKVLSQDREAQQSIERSRDANTFLALARAITACSAYGVTATEYCESERLHPTVKDIVEKAGVNVSTTGNTANFFAPLASAFTQSLAPSSVLDRLFALGATRAPNSTLAISVTTLIDAGDTPESAPKPASSLSFNRGAMTLCKVAAYIVISNELAKFATPGSNTLFNTELRTAVVKACNTKLIGALYALTTPSASTGTDANAILNDIEVMLKAVPLASNSKPLFLFTSNDIKAMATKLTSLGSPAFADLNVVSGGNLFGIPVMPVNELPNGGALLIDSTGLILSDEGIELDASRQTTLQLESAPLAETSATVMQSLFASNLTALRAERMFAYSPPRPASMAALSGVNY